ncbi:MAG TPA: hypothetical protein PK711_01985 [Bacteroidales bacterium]|nr:hypothetical protein [Bacteroidales bacterium]
MLLRRSHRIFPAGMLLWMLMLLLFSGCQVIYSWRIDRINRIPEENAMREEKLIEKGYLEQQKQFDKDYKNAVKAHKKRQSDATIAQMKYMKKRSAYVNRHRKRSFCDRLFNPSCR